METKPPTTITLLTYFVRWSVMFGCVMKLKPKEAYKDFSLNETRIWMDEQKHA